ncbi:hypothetical protein NH340_JMT01489 [Sarcoptes scabiei]|nr:hypothetical protein NH340_JMT01489 [Sarcoptes scabiei]
MEKRKEIDLAQAQEISKHLITDIINQAVLLVYLLQLFDIVLFQNEPESLSKLSYYSQRSMNQNNCSWLTRTRHALARIMRHTCICTRAMDQDHQNNQQQQQQQQRQQSNRNLLIGSTTTSSREVCKHLCSIEIDYIGAN